MDDTADFKGGLWLLLIRTFHVMRRARQKELNGYGITTRSAAVLSAVLRLGKEATLRQLARQLVLEEHSMSEQLLRMEKTGLIKRVKDPKKNLIHVRITKKGRDLYDKSMERKSVENIMSVLTKEEQLNLWLTIAKIREQSLKELGKLNENMFPPSDPALFEPEEYSR